MAVSCQSALSFWMKVGAAGRHSAEPRWGVEATGFPFVPDARARERGGSCVLMGDTVRCQPTQSPRNRGRSWQRHGKLVAGWNFQPGSRVVRREEPEHAHAHA